MNDDAPSPAPPAPTPADGGHARALATVWFTLFLDLVAFGLIIPVLPFYAEHFGAAAWMVTLLSTVFSLAQFVMSPVLGRLSDRHGRRRIMLISIAGSTSALLLLGLATSLWMVFLARLLNGACNANVSTAHAYVADRVAPAERARYMGMMGSAIGIGFIVGPSLGGLLSTPEMPHLPFYVGAALNFVNLVMAFFWLPESRHGEPGRPAVHAGPQVGPLARLRLLVGGELRGTQIGVLATVSFGFYTAFATMESTFALFTEREYQWTARETGYMFTYIGFTIAIVQGLVVGRLVPRLGERRTLYLGIGAMAAGFLLQGGVVSIPVLVLAGALVAGGNGLISPSLSALVSRASSADDQGLNMGLVQSASSLGRISGPAAAGVLFEAISPRAPMICGGLLALVVLALALRSVRDPADAATA
ncbi:MAG: MFS transporter [Nannocystaceae bacterium]